MKMKIKFKQFMAMFLCILMVTKLVVPTLATVIATDSNENIEHVVLNTGDGNGNAERDGGLNPSKETASNATKETSSNAICVICGKEPCECVICVTCGEKNCTEHATGTENAVQVGEVLWIRSGSSVYSETTEKKGYTLKFSYEVKIVNILLDEENEPEWYEFKCNKLSTRAWWNIFVGEAYKYVRAENVSLTDPGDTKVIDEHACICGEDAPENLSQHADSCPRKQYVLSLIKNESGGYKTAAELYEDWDSFDDATQTDILNMLRVYSKTTYDKFMELFGKETYENILNELKTLEDEYETLTEDECEEFYSKIMEIYSRAFENDVAVVTSEELQEIDEQCLALARALNLDFGYSPLEAPVMLVDEMNSDENDTTGAVYANKWVSTNGTVSDYLLTLESYVTGYNQDYVQPVDLILVLDQSASMYAPMGLSAALDNKSIYKETPDGLIRYAFDSEVLKNGCIDLGALLVSDETDLAGNTFKDRIGQLGYLVAQSRGGGCVYCYDKTPGHKHSNSCKTYDWFIVQYVADDSEGKPWHMHRVKITASPSTDGDKDFTYNDKLLKYSDDEIGTMQFYFYKSQTGALYDAMTSFAAELKNSDGDHRVAVAGFASGVKHPKYDPEDIECSSGIYIGSEFVPYSTKSGRTDPKGEAKWDWIADANTIYSMSTLSSEDASRALMSVKNDYDDIKNAIDGVKTDYYETFQNVGLDIALKIVNAAPEVESDLDGYIRKKIVVLFTDGEPAGPELNDVVSKAKELKDAGAEIYTVCTSTLASDKREFLNYSSSDYPDAESMESPGEKKFNKYIKTAKDSGELVTQFLSIIKDVGGAYITLHEDTVLQDAITDDFTLPKALLDALNGPGGADTDTVNQYVNVYTADYNGTDFEMKKLFADARVHFEKDSDDKYSIIKVSNFDYSENYVSENGRGANDDFYGKKLIVEIAINVAEDNYGGIKLPTNEEDTSGIYSGDECIKTFPVPYVDVPTTVTVSKVVEGRNADENRQFDFLINSWQIGGYSSETEGASNYLKAGGNNENSTGTLHHGQEMTIETLVGSTFVVSESEDKNYTPSIKVYDVNDTDITDRALTNHDGQLEIKVVPGMKIEYTNTVTLADLVIVKKGIETIDENQSCIFKITGPDNFEMEVVVMGNNSVTIKDIPVGSYKVSEMNDWTWRYTIKSITPADGLIEVTAMDENKVTFENERTKDHWLSGDSYCENWWGGNNGSSIVNNRTKQKTVSK